MPFVRTSIGVQIFSLMVWQIFGRAMDYPDENLLDLVFQTDTPTSTPEDCRCIPKNLCTNTSSRKNLTEESIDGSDYIMPKFLGPYCPNPQHICCEPSMITTSTSSPGTDKVNYPLPKPTRQCECAQINNCLLYDGIVIKNTNGEGLINPRLGECPDPQHICCDQLREATDTTTKRYVRKQMNCGVRHEEGVGFKISGGNEAQFGEFPWIVVIFKKKFRDEEEFLQFNCGGSLIHLKIVLTAAHCVKSYMDKPHLITIRAGEWDTESLSETVSHQERVAEKIIVHPSFNSGNKAYDVALVVLKDQFEFAENVDVVCLPDANTDVDQANCIAAGWGKDSFDADSYSNILKKLDLPLVPKTDCQNKISAIKSSIKLHESIICAGGKKGVDTCYGDGGGPLFCPVPGASDDIYQQVGIVSWGIGCGAEIPSFYANVPIVRSWIDSEVENLGLKY